MSRDNSVQVPSSPPPDAFLVTLDGQLGKFKVSGDNVWAMTPPVFAMGQEQWQIVSPEQSPDVYNKVMREYHMLMKLSKELGYSGGKKAA